MKTTIWSLTLSLLALAMQGAGFKSFSKSCMAIDGQFYSEDKVGFYCFTKNVAQFEYMYSLIDLRHCVANNVGSLVGYKDGNYHKSCDDCKLESVKDSQGTQIGTCYLSCDCYDMEGQRHRAKFDLKALVTVPLQSVIIILSATRANHAYRHDHKGQAWALTRGHKAGASAVGQELLEKGISKGVAYDAVHLEKISPPE
ncbi:hypothetical protein NLU13_1805 [Sarocladium strictum]|uniref:Cyanovirin-N domain-containing protein n=1 Tax=Sarocladium strictum TaxID=5046 RepID=A0AA39GSE9_SARSR|nr:hypothetical protein NLU13_1805 [Sarocladium strictum]